MRATARISLIAAATIAGVLAAVAPAQASSAVVLSVGHVDVVGVAYEDGALNLHVHDEGTDAEYAPHQVRLDVLPAAQTEVPDEPSYAFLGSAGAPVWILPEVEDENLIWAGFGTEELESGVFVNDEVKVNIVGKYGPADVSIFTTDPFGAARKLADTGDGLPDTITLAAGQHVHANWAFEATGDYYVLVVATGKLASNNKTVVSNPGLYHFKVQS